VRVIRSKQVDGEKGDHHPPQIVESHVLDKRAGHERNRRAGGRQGSQHLGAAPPAHVARHQPGEQYHPALGQGGEQAQPGQPGAEDCQGNAGDERSQGRVSNITPIQLAGVHQDIQLIAMQTVLPVEQGVQQHAAKSEQEQNLRVTERGD
jgi:hypothetical protein